MKKQLHILRLFFIAMLAFVSLTSCQFFKKSPKAVYQFTLRASISELVAGYAEGNKDAFFNTALTQADSLSASGKISFVEALTKIYSAPAAGRLSPTLAPTPTFSGKIQGADPNSKTLQVLDSIVKADVEEEIEQLRQRLDLHGIILTQTAHTDYAKGIIAIECKDMNGSPLSSLRQLITTTGKLEFWDTYENEELIDNLINADKSLANLLTIQKQVVNENNRQNPILSILIPRTDHQIGTYPGAAIGTSLAKDTAAVNRLMTTEIVRLSFPRDVKFVWAAKPLKENNAYELFAIKFNPATFPQPPLDGQAIKETSAGYDQSGNPAVMIILNEDGAPVWETMTEEAAYSKLNVKGKESPLKRCVAIVIDNKVYSAPRVQTKIINGTTQISGLASEDEAKNLATILKLGRLHTSLTLIEEKVLDSSKTGAQ